MLDTVFGVLRQKMMNSNQLIHFYKNLKNKQKMENETVKHKDAKMLGLMVLLVATVVAIGAGFSAMFPGGGAGVDWFHGVPAIACAGYCAFLVSRAMIRLHNKD